MPGEGSLPGFFYIVSAVNLRRCLSLCLCGKTGFPTASHRHGRTAQASPSGPWPVGILPETSSVCMSITATALSPASAT